MKKKHFEDGCRKCSHFSERTGIYGRFGDDEGDLTSDVSQVQLRCELMGKWQTVYDYRTDDVYSCAWRRKYWTMRRLKEL